MGEGEGGGGPGDGPALPLPLRRRGIITSSVTSDSLGQAQKQSILHNLENQPSLQKHKGAISEIKTDI